MNRIKEYRIKKGLTQRELAGMVGVTDVSISKYETGRVNPRKSVILLLCKVLMTSEDKLFPQEEEKQETTLAQKAMLDGMLYCGNATYSQETIDGRNYVVFRVKVN